MVELNLVAYFLNSTLVNIIILLIIVVYLLKCMKSVRQRFFAWIYVLILKHYSGRLTPYKKELFAPLQNFLSLNATLRNQGLIRILEIGPGPGVNFNFYPKNARVTLIDPNPHFNKYLERNRAKFPNLKIEKVILGEGEDLGEIKDDSVDVVVTTAVLCSVHNVPQVLSEIQRVLAPGGTYFFMEHVIGPKGSWTRLTQKLAFYFWKGAFCGCQITRETEKAIKQMGFIETKFKNVMIDMNWLWLVGPHVYGTVKKA